MPTTRSFGKPVICFMSVTITSSGFDTTITSAFGACFLMASATVLMIFGVDAEEVVAAHAGLPRARRPSRCRRPRPRCRHSRSCP